MAMLACGECGKEYSDQAKACVHCGARNPAKMGGGEKFITIAFWGFVGVAVIIGGLVWIGSNDPYAADREAIRACHQIEEQRAHDPESVLACRQMEDDLAARMAR